MNDKTKNILSRFGKIPIFVTEQFPFALFLVVLFVIFLANLLFYKYYILDQKVIKEAAEEHIVINDKNYNDLLKIWVEQDKKFQDSGLKIYIDIQNPR